MSTKVLIAVLTTYERTGWPHPDLLQWCADLPLQEGYATRVVKVHNFVPAAAGRNVFCKQMQDSDADWLCMVDNDMAPPQDMLDTLKDAPPEADIIVPAFYLWDQTKGKCTLCWGLDSIPKEQQEGFGRFAPGFHELTKCGTGVIFIRPRVLQKLEYPYFWYTYNADQGCDGTEDINFCIKARAAGFRIFGNSRIRVGHYHSVDLNVMASLLFDKHNPLDTPIIESVHSPATADASPAMPSNGESRQNAVTA